ncbi:MAG: bifunctional UDP-N-acetylglucosamine diphosphorylase/glucosamine-1-phosphate N-acetyltransferase GlmU [Proteobacteria bacterium]|nr:bifunctional UDP-N-acetylglucosamine diphosphorylase/glucosamine-1-phosphate N-acetyltransferase GlmU [Pseudomonadota bacterium]
MRKVAGLILAAGRSTRMNSARSKVLHNLAGRPVLSYVIDAAHGAGADPIKVVIAPGQVDMREHLKSERIEAVVQREQLGTAHAVMVAERSLSGFKGDVLILCGDVPLIRAESLREFICAVRARAAVLGVLTMAPADPTGYGRIVRDLDGSVVKIAEERDASPEERAIREVNSGILMADREWLFSSLRRIGNGNAKGEYYLTDLVGVALKEGIGVTAHRCDPAEEFHGINTRVDLARAAELLRERINKGLMLSGAGLVDYRHTYVDSTARIGRDTEVLPFTFIMGKTRIGSGCTIENGVVIRDAVIGDSVHIKAGSVIEESRISDNAVVGPFARVRPGSSVGEGARIGNFVELKKCAMRKGAKANHLSYLGDAVVGAGANIGCGTITCNYDGVNKHMTVIGDGAFVGSDTQFIAPVRVGRGAVIGAGSTITRDVPAGALALSRSEQKTVKGYAERKGKSRRQRKK